MNVGPDAEVAARHAAEAFFRYTAGNPMGGDITAPEKVMCFIPDSMISTNGTH